VIIAIIVCFCLLTFGIVLLFIGSIQSREKDFAAERSELMARIDALTAAVGRDKGIYVDLKPRVLEKSPGWFDGKRDVVVKPGESA
jgi:hypothetical protein